MKGQFYRALHNKYSKIFDPYYCSTKTIRAFKYSGIILIKTSFI